MTPLLNGNEGGNPARALRAACRCLRRNKPAGSTSNGWGVKVFGDDVRDLQLFAGKSLRLPWLGATLRLQLDVCNATNDNHVEPGLYAANSTALYRVCLRAPRNFRPSAIVDL